jgi:transposase
MPSRAGRGSSGSGCRGVLDEDALRRPGGGAGVPGLGERDQVVDVQGAGRGEVGVVVRRVPGSAAQPATRVLLGSGDRFRAPAPRHPRRRRGRGDLPRLQPLLPGGVRGDPAPQHRQDVPARRGRRRALRQRRAHRTKAWADNGYKTKAVEEAAHLGIDLQIVQRDPTTRGFHVQPRRWVIERTLGWLMHHRRPARDYETHPHRSAAMIQIAAINLTTRRLAHETTTNWRDS